MGKLAEEIARWSFDITLEERNWMHAFTDYDALSETGEMGLLTNSTQCDAVDYHAKRLDYRLTRGFNILKGEI